MTFIDELKNATNFSVTENGATGYKTTYNELLDFNFKVPSFRVANEKYLRTEVRSLINSISDKVLLYRYIFYLRDVRGGMGERRIFRMFIQELADSDFENINALIPLIAEYGRYDDLFVLRGTKCERAMFDYIREIFNEDYVRMSEGKSITLLAKWMPSENASSLDTKMLAKEFINYLDISPKTYRKMLSAMRKYSNVVETYISRNMYDLIDYQGVPSKANLKYARLFLDRDYKRRKDFLDSLSRGGVKVNSSVSYPSDVIAYLRSELGNHFGAYYGTCDVDIDTKNFLDGMWKGLRDFGNIENVLVVADVSGSMIGSPTNVSPIDVSIGLGMYFAQRNKAPFDRKVVTFAHNPQYIELKDCSVVDNYVKMIKMNWDGDTNIEAVFNMVLRSAVKAKCKQEEIPTILVVSDMEFNYCGEKAYQHAFDKISDEYRAFGYELPKLVFWNVSSRTNTIPVTEGKNGVVLVSGYSPSSIRAVMSGELDPYKALLKCFYTDRYDMVEKALKLS